MTRLRSIAFFIIGSAALQLWAASPGTKGPPNIFESFHLLDNQFTRLDTQFQDLQHGLASDDSRAHTAREWQRAARQMGATTIQIRKSSYRLYRRYGGRGALSHQMFLRLHSRAGVLQARLLLLARARSRKLAQREETRAAKAMLDLVLQYQAVTGGYAAATCDAGAWSCGVAKKEPRKAGYPNTGVKWTCVKRQASCRGILGPRSPLLTESPLTVSGQTH